MNKFVVGLGVLIFGLSAVAPFAAAYGEPGFCISGKVIICYDPENGMRIGESPPIHANLDKIPENQDRIHYWADNLVFQLTANNLPADPIPDLPPFPPLP